METHQEKIQRRIKELSRAGKLPHPKRGEVYFFDIIHAKDCARYKGTGPCDCDIPDIKVKGVG